MKLEQLYFLQSNFQNVDKLKLKTSWSSFLGPSVQSHLDLLRKITSESALGATGAFLGRASIPSQMRDT